MQENSQINITNHDNNKITINNDNNNNINDINIKIAEPKIESSSRINFYINGQNKNNSIIKDKNLKKDKDLFLIILIEINF